MHLFWELGFSILFKRWFTQHTVRIEALFIASQSTTKLTVSFLMKKGVIRRFSSKPGTRKKRAFPAS